MTDNFEFNIRASLSCGKCGSKEITIPDNPVDESPVTCSACGEKLTTWGEAQTAIREAAKKEGTEAVKDAFRKIRRKLAKL